MFTQKITSLTFNNLFNNKQSMTDKKLNNSALSFKAISAENTDKLIESPLKKFMATFFGNFPKLDFSEIIRRIQRTNDKQTLVPKIGETKNGIRSAIASQRIFRGREARKSPVNCTYVTPKYESSSNRFKK